MSKPHIVQCLCGPQRHCIMALAYEPGETCISGRDRPVTADAAPDLLRTFLDAAIVTKQINPWCAICRTPRAQWVFEDAVLIFDTLEEAQPYLRQLEEQQRQSREFIQRGKN